MSSLRQHGGGPDSDATEDPTLSRDRWPVDEHWVVEPGSASQGSNDAQPDEPDPGGTAPPPPASGSRVAAWLVAPALVALLLFGSAAAWVATRDPDPGSPPPAQARTTPSVPSAGATTTSPATSASSISRSVPDVTGLSVAEARTRLTADGFHVRVRSQVSDSPPDEVLRQVPDAGSEVERGSTVLVVVSRAPPNVDVPDVVGLAADAAAHRLRSLGLTPRMTVVRSAKASGTVLDQSPAPGATLEKDGVVRLRVAKQVRRTITVSVPDLVGLTVDSARQKLAAAGLAVSVTEIASDRPERQVVSQSPSAGTEIRKGTRVQLTVSSGPAPVAVPSVVGLDETSARDQLEAAGFVVQLTSESTSDPSADGAVTAQDPAGGTSAPRGSTVVVTVARYG